MNNNGIIDEKCLHDFHAIALRVLSSSDKSVVAFEENWKIKNYRVAYLIYFEERDRIKAHLSDSEKKIETEFYWVFVN